MSSLTAIVAISDNHVIGYNNGLPWYIPEDLLFFKTTTIGHIVIMGRNTFESLPSCGLCNRICVVLTSQPIIYTTMIHPITEVIFTSAHEIYNQIKDLRHEYPTKQVFVIGGKQVFDFFQHDIDTWIVTHIHKNIIGDVCYEFDGSIYPKTQLIEEYFCVSENCRVTRNIYSL